MTRRWGIGLGTLLLWRGKPAPLDGAVQGRHPIRASTDEVTNADGAVGGTPGT